jgi:hypothetical protein
MSQVNRLSTHFLKKIAPVAGATVRRGPWVVSAGHFLTLRYPSDSASFSFDHK